MSRGLDGESSRLLLLLLLLLHLLLLLLLCAVSILLLLLLLLLSTCGASTGHSAAATMVDARCLPTRALCSLLLGGHDGKETGIARERVCRCCGRGHLALALLARLRRDRRPRLL